MFPGTRVCKILTIGSLVGQLENRLVILDSQVVHNASVIKGTSHPTRAFVKHFASEMNPDALEFNPLTSLFAIECFEAVT